MNRSEIDRPFADRANRLNHMPWTLPGYRPIVPHVPFWRRVIQALRG